jgi:flagellar biosynthesis protein
MAQAPRPQAVALRYDPERDAAPKVVAKGQGRWAEQIVRTARQHYVPIHHDPHLVRVLSHLRLDQEIPPQLYQAVAAVLAFLYRLQQQPLR